MTDLEPLGSKAVRACLMHLRQGHGLVDVRKFTRLTEQEVATILDVPTGNLSNGNREIEVYRRIVSLIFALPEDLLQVATAQYNISDAIQGKTLDDREWGLADLAGVNAKTIRRSGDVALGALTIAIMAGSPGAAPNKHAERLGLLLGGRPAPLSPHSSVASSSPGTRKKRSNLAAAKTLSRQQLTAEITRSLADVSRWAVDISNADGGIPSDNKGSLSGTWPSSGLLWALLEAPVQIDVRWAARVLSWVVENTNPDGGTPICTLGDPSVVDATAQAVLASASMYRLTRDDYYLDKSASLVRWLIRHASPRGGWPWRPSIEAGTAWVVSSCYAILALSETAKHSAGRNIALGNQARDAANEGIDWLISIRNLDGGWGGEPGALSGASPTGMAVYAIVATTQGGKSPGADLARWIEEHARDKPKVTLDRPVGHTVVRWAAGNLTLGAAALDDPDLTLARPLLGNLMKSFDTDHFRYRDSTMHTWPTRDGVLALTACLRALKG